MNPEISSFGGSVLRSSSEIPTSTDCAQNPVVENVIFMNCEVVSGNSGSPVLDLTPVGPRVVGVVSATTNGGALAVTLQDWMLAYLPNAW